MPAREKVYNYRQVRQTFDALEQCIPGVSNVAAAILSHCRQEGVDIYVNKKEVSRRHVVVTVDEFGKVWLPLRESLSASARRCSTNRRSEVCAADPVNDMLGVSE